MVPLLIPLLLLLPIGLLFHTIVFYAQSVLCTFSPRIHARPVCTHSRPKQAIHILIPVIASLSLELKCGPLLRFILVAATKTNSDSSPATSLNNTDLGVSSLLRLFDINNYCHQSIFHVQLLALVVNFEGSKATNVIRGVAQAISEMRFVLVEDKN